MRVEILQVVHLHEVERLRAHEPVRIGELAPPARSTGRPDLGGEEWRSAAGLMPARMSPTRSSELPVHRRAVDHAAARTSGSRARPRRAARNPRPVAGRRAPARCRGRARGAARRVRGMARSIAVSGRVAMREGGQRPPAVRGLATRQPGSCGSPAMDLLGPSWAHEVPDWRRSKARPSRETAIAGIIRAAPIHA